MDEQAGRVVVVTGAGQGIGAGIARAFAAAGAVVAVTDLDEERAHAVAAQLPSSRAWAMDVTSRDDVGRVAADIASTLGHPAVLVNNAGLNRVGPSATLSPADWDLVVDVNLNGTFNCCQAFVGGMLRAGSGSIISISSINGLLGMPGRAAYCATKAAIIGLTQALGTEWAPSGVRVNAVAPGYVWTPMLAGAVESGLYGESSILDRVPLRQYARVEQIADAVLYLASERSSFVVGQTLVVDGGYSAYGAPTPTSTAITERFSF